MPQYMLLIYSTTPSPDQLAEEHPKWGAFTQELKDSGAFVNGDALQGVDVATTVREIDGELQLTDGPFAETKEHLGGYYTIDVPEPGQGARVRGPHAAHRPRVGRGQARLGHDPDGRRGQPGRGVGVRALYPAGGRLRPPARWRLCEAGAIDSRPWRFERPWHCLACGR